MLSFRVMSWRKDECAEQPKPRQRKGPLRDTQRNAGVTSGTKQIPVPPPGPSNIIIRTPSILPPPKDVVSQ